MFISMTTTRRSTVTNSKMRLPRHSALLPSNLRQVCKLMTLNSFTRVTRTRRIRRERVLLTVATVYHQVSRRNLKLPKVNNPRRVTTPRVTIGTHQLINYNTTRRVQRHFGRTLDRLGVTLVRLTAPRAGISRQTRPSVDRVTSQINPLTNVRFR